ncbi:unnamed protein product [Chondrus crispus]|uniref:Uncharacterized protein n=1 Tax=Chondrus crispus TaxID=2769 RepID=R7Q9T3_CHOCR|nr:unnamed protein product [Chondrus crispus]CDF34819.1 unnamed protein product [Chondrus crispus]|eukprot:XP_005714638.1 unnamed protein product [Chondrus crispus]
MSLPNGVTAMSRAFAMPTPVVSCTRARRRLEVGGVVEGGQGQTCGWRLASRALFSFTARALGSRLPHSTLLSSLVGLCSALVARLRVGVLCAVQRLHEGLALVQHGHVCRA